MAIARGEASAASLDESPRREDARRADEERKRRCTGGASSRTPGRRLSLIERERSASAPAASSASEYARNLRRVGRRGRGGGARALARASPPPKSKLASGFVSPRSSSVSASSATARVRGRRAGEERRRRATAETESAVSPPPPMLTSGSPPVLAVRRGRFGTFGTSMPLRAEHVLEHARARLSGVRPRPRRVLLARQVVNAVDPSLSEDISRSSRSDAARPWSISPFSRCSRRSRSASFSWRGLMALRNCWCASSSVGSRASVSVMKLTCSETSESFRPGETAVEIQRGLAGAASRRGERGAPGEGSAPGAILDEAEMVPSGVLGAPPALRRDIGVARAGRVAARGWTWRRPVAIGSARLTRRRGGQGDAIRGVPAARWRSRPHGANPAGLITHRRVETPRGCRVVLPAHSCALGIEEIFLNGSNESASCRVLETEQARPLRELEPPRERRRSAHSLPRPPPRPRDVHATNDARARICRRAVGAGALAPRPRQRRRDAARSHPRVAEGHLDAHSSRDEAQPYR